MTCILDDFLQYFPQKWLKGSRATPKSAHKTQTWTPRVPKWSPKVAPKSPKASQLYTMCVKMEAKGATMEPKGNPKCQIDTKRRCKVHRDPKNMYKPPAAGCSPKAT